MSTNDLRSSLQEALSFQPTYRTRKSTQNLASPYLDRVSVTEHRGSPKESSTLGSNSSNNKRFTKSSYKNLIIRPIGVPDLRHTKLQTCFAPEEVPFTAPTGKILKGLRTTLQRGYIDAVKSTNEEAKASRTRRLEQERRDKKHQDYTDDDDERYEDDRGLEESSKQSILFDRQKYEEAMAYESLEDASQYASSKTTKKTSYSAPPKFEAFLDFVYGPSNLNGTYSRSHNNQMKEYLPVSRK
jgi:hypothetical protein